MEKETINGEEFRKMLAQYTTIPEENLAAASSSQATRAALAAEAIEL